MSGPAAAALTVAGVFVDGLVAAAICRWVSIPARGSITQVSPTYSHIRGLASWRVACAAGVFGRERFLVQHALALRNIDDNTSALYRMQCTAKQPQSPG